jgi:hypothetical protein
VAFSDFKRLGDAVKKFQLRTKDQRGLFASCPDVVPSQLLRDVLERGAPVAAAIGTEKARSELIVAQILLELTFRAPHVSLFSGIDLTVDAAAGLSGICDFLLSRGEEQFMLTAPVVALVEAKRDDIHEGLGQCVAEMVAAQRWNQREENEIPAIYGAVTTGTVWTFLRLTGQTVTIDLHEYTLTQPEKLLGILLAMVLGTAPVSEEAPAAAAE